MTKKISHHLANGDEVASDHPWVTDDASYREQCNKSNSGKTWNTGYSCTPNVW